MTGRLKYSISRNNADITLCFIFRSFTTESKRSDGSSYLEPLQSNEGGEDAINPTTNPICLLLLYPHKQRGCVQLGRWTHLSLVDGDIMEHI